MTNHTDPFQEKPLKRLQMYFCLIPVLGIVPALWMLVRQEGDREQQAVSRLAITLALAWLLAYTSFAVGAAQTSEIIKFRLLFLDGLLASGYTLTCLGLMLRLWRKKSLRLPGMSQWSEKFGPRF
ncbi:hypothetical protein [Oscillatoria sp. FACHB-1406]|uniref:hypothetical protein n=1 Tax=Oscillatoria sp. FACHB-1406 TaxID=2692846 RepID=UPI001688DD8D|nr:hypothetical protein [Oscillatoria sp. FACHB-1406]MBD2576141.1 hypothetical protein [Oscillatoria sp. FACHB-1406]